MTNADPGATDGTWVPDRDIDQVTEHLRGKEEAESHEATEAVLFDPFADEELSLIHI